MTQIIQISIMNITCIMSIRMLMMMMMLLLLLLLMLVLSHLDTLKFHDGIGRFRSSTPWSTPRCCRSSRAWRWPPLRSSPSPCADLGTCGQHISSVSRSSGTLRKYYSRKTTGNGCGFGSHYPANKIRNNVRLHESTTGRLRKTTGDFGNTARNYENGMTPINHVLWFP